MNHHLFINDLKKHVQGDVLTDNVSLGLYATDASIYQITPIAVVLPKSNKDVLLAIKIAGDHSVSILPRGGGTSLAGQAVGQSMVLDFSKYLNQIIELNEEEKWVRVQPGIVRDKLNQYLSQFGLHFAPDPATSSRANIGGMIGNNSSGTKSILYGKTVDHVLEMKVVLSDSTELQFQNLSRNEFLIKGKQSGREGAIYNKISKIILDNETEIQAAYPQVMRRVQGYNLDEFAGKNHWNLSKLICGSEGTLATILEAKINLEPLPNFKSVCVVHFSELLEAIQAVKPMLPYCPSAIEILDDTVVKLSRENLLTQRHAHFIEGNPVAIQIVEFYGDTLEDVMKRPQDMINQLKALGLGYAYPLFPSGKNYEDVWVIRKKGLGLMLGIKGNKKPLPFIEDAGIPTDVLPEYIDRVLKICQKHQTEAAMYAHASVGVIHVRPILDLRLKEDIERFKNIADETFELVKEYGGSWSGEHGDGLVRSYYLERYFGSQVYDLLRQVKQLFDPDHRMNPGKIIDAKPIDQNLRYGHEYADNQVNTVFKYRVDGSFENAVHMCTGVGECRKIIGGTMCPSYKATRDEEHSTRGRANALRLAMSRQLGPDGLTDKRLIDVLDLCLSCKACKSECPSNVDMAKLKGEVLQMKYDQNGAALRDRFIRDSAKVASKISGKGAGIFNTIIKNPIVRSVLETATGFDKRRKLPAYAPNSFSNWFAKNYIPPNIELPKVILFADTYLNYHEPHIGISTTKLLNAFGYEVILGNVGCCQRPKISHGFLKNSKKAGSLVAVELTKLIQEDIPILVCEPSCASSLVDDLPDLLDDPAMANRMQSNVFLLENYIAQHIKSGKKTPTLSSKAKHVLFHGHCHQKALFGTESIKTIFNKVKDIELAEIPSGCCGMAGSFGYEKEHYSLSKKIGEEILFPAIRDAAKDTTVIASGFSCRHQIHDFTQRKAMHWVEIIEVAN